MATRKAPSAGPQVRAYLMAQPPQARRYLKQMREIIRRITPAAVETFSYGIPGFRLDGRVYIYYAGFRSHVSLYPMTEAIRRAHAKQLAGYGMSTGTVRFPLYLPLPIGLVRKLVRARAAEVRAR